MSRGRSGGDKAQEVGGKKPEPANAFQAKLDELKKKFEK
jgi:hypothetical protein